MELLLLLLKLMVVLVANGAVTVEMRMLELAESCPSHYSVKDFGTSSENVSYLPDKESTCRSTGRGAGAEDSGITCFSANLRCNSLYDGVSS